jgi:hypothetical protein
MVKVFWLGSSQVNPFACAVLLAAGGEVFRISPLVHQADS